MGDPGPPIPPGGGGPFVAGDGAARAASLPPPPPPPAAPPVGCGGGVFIAAYGGNGYGGYAYGAVMGLVIIMFVDAACINGGRIAIGAGLLLLLLLTGAGVVDPAGNVASTVAMGNAAVVDDGIDVLPLWSFVPNVDVQRGFCAAGKCNAA